MARENYTLCNEPYERINVSLSVKDILASATADADQCQSLIDETRLMFASDQSIQLELDRQQRELDQKIARINLTREIADIFGCK